jgi:hypothetical protein
LVGFSFKFIEFNVDVIDMIEPVVVLVLLLLLLLLALMRASDSKLCAKKKVRKKNRKTTLNGAPSRKQHLRVFQLILFVS